MHGGSDRPNEEVTIVSRNAETLGTLRSYLRDAGVTARCLRGLVGCADAAGSRTIALVLFPDDFAWELVIATMAELASKHPTALPVLVTAHPQRFVDLTSSETVVILPRPAWGWTILDAIRAHHARR
jgi:hypothetical protein